MFMFQGSKKKQQQLWSCCQKRLQEFKQLQYQHQQLYQSFIDQQSLPPPYTSQTTDQQQQQNSSNLSKQDVCMSTSFESSVDDNVLCLMETDTGSSTTEEMSIEQEDCYETKTDGYVYENYPDNSIDYSYDEQNSIICSESMEKSSMLSKKELLITEQCSNRMFHQFYTTNNNLKSNAGILSMGSAAVQNCLCATVDSTLSDSNAANYYQIQHQQQDLSGKCHFNNNTNLMTEQVQQTQSAMTSSLTVTATNIFRRCCRGRNSLSNESSIENTLNDDNVIKQIQNHYNNNNNGHNHNSNRKNNKNGFDFERNIDESSVKELFQLFIKKLKKRQLSALCHIVGKTEGIRQSPIKSQLNALCHAGGKTEGTLQSPIDCLLVRREPIVGEEPNIIVCRLFLWPDLRMASELKRIPTCPSGGDKVYVCCNPDHWNRILTTEMQPLPPYQPLEMDRLRPEDHSLSENSRDGGVSSLSGSTTTGLRVQIPESFSTSGEESSSQSFGWCQIAYWELEKRVGDRFKAENSIITIGWEGSDGMCLKKLATEGNSELLVKKTRNQIGLGIILSQEADGVWLYNRSTVAIFVHSPTLNDDCTQVSKVPPGRCLNAFDKNRARMQEQGYSGQTAGSQEGPIDTFSMQISFVKGWSGKYKRPNITKCPCWLEVLFSRR